MTSSYGTAFRAPSRKTCRDQRTPCALGQSRRRGWKSEENDAELTSRLENPSRFCEQFAWIVNMLHEVLGVNAGNGPVREPTQDSEGIAYHIHSWQIERVDPNRLRISFVRRTAKFQVQGSAIQRSPIHVS